MKKSHCSLLTFLILFLISFNILTAFANDGETVTQRSAHDVYMELLESSVTFKAVEVSPNAESAPVTFGAEKEGSSHLITRVMGPNGPSFEEFGLRESVKFKREFMQRFVSGQTRIRNIIDINGVDKSMTKADIASLKGNYDRMSETQIDAKYKRFIQLTEDKPLSYLTHAERKRLFNGTSSHQRNKLQYYSYRTWTPNFGKPQKYIDSAHMTISILGWEINFKPLNTYGEFEEFIYWFKESLKNAGRLFQAPGHQRIVFPTPDKLNLTDTQKAEWHNKMNDLMRNVQAYIVVRGILGNTGIENSQHKKIHIDSNLNLFNSRRSENGRGVIRFDRAERFVPDTYSVELRAGTKDAHVQQFIEQVITARVGTGEISDLRGLSDYSLFDGTPPSASNISSRFKVSKEVATRFLENSNLAFRNQAFNIAIWNWMGAPYMRGKKNVLLWATQNYLTIVAGTTDKKIIKKALQKWIRTVGLDTSIKEYIRPKRFVTEMERLHHHRSTGRVNVNQIDLGIEYSARFANKYSIELAESISADGKKIWLNTKTGMTPHERKIAIRNMAISLGHELNGKNVTVTDASTTGAHG
ncbi:MAG: hypothetical protein HOJ35_05105, partial [Bdellovibrionales bacterium]|nr:hypothetical protein [Bdellovibrionales bacterium]